MDGLKATQAIRAINHDHPNHNIPLIAVTAHAMRGDRDTCLASGMNDYLPKPIDPEQLAAAIEKHLPSRPKSLGACLA